MSYDPGDNKSHGDSGSLRIRKNSPRNKEKPAAKGFFGLLSDWKIDTQALKDELRD